MVSTTYMYDNMGIDTKNQWFRSGSALSWPLDPDPNPDPASWKLKPKAGI
jgi:hypothetical protein